ncbi:conserved Plasmodium protein, unknown function [Plasmodium sp. gorilla clade G1]|nr:conserved Plasmodium protein, unknown function [Plasmodium sp. gorilla clade G1]
MDKFKICKKRILGSLKKNKFIKKKYEKFKERKDYVENDFITNSIIKYLNKEKYENKTKKVEINEFIGEDENLKVKLYGKEDIQEEDIIKRCLFCDKDNKILEQLSYRILYDVMKKCIDHENVLMKIEELGFTADNIKDEKDENINICSKYKVDTFLDYIYKNLNVIKFSKNFQGLCKFIHLIKSVIFIIPYVYKVKFLFLFCSLFNIYQKEYESGKQNDTNIHNKNNKKEYSNLINIVDEDEFFTLYFELINQLINLKDNYNSYDENYKIFNYFVLRWILIFFKNKNQFFLSQKKMSSLIKSKYVILLFSLLKNLHESSNMLGNFDISTNEKDILLSVNKNNGHMLNQSYNNMSENEPFLSQNINESHYINNMYNNNMNNYSYDDNMNDINLLDKLVLNVSNKKNKEKQININKSVLNDKIYNNISFLKNMIVTFYDKVDMNIEKEIKEVKDNMNELTQNIFINVYNILNCTHLIHKHMILLYFSFNFLKMSSYEYSYFIVVNAFNMLNNLLTVQNFVIHPLLFLCIQEVLTFYENIIIHLYKEKGNELNEEFYIFVQKFNNKHKNIYSKLIRRIWSLYMLIISDDYVKNSSNKEDMKINVEQSVYGKSYLQMKHDQQMDIQLDGQMNGQMNGHNNYIQNNNITGIIKLVDLDFSNEYKSFLLNNINNTYRSSLINCLCLSYRILGLEYFLDEYFFFTHKELLAKDIFLLNKIIKDSNKLYYGGNFKFLMNFFYPLLIFYIDLYQKEEEHTIKKKQYMVYIKNVLNHFSSSLNDCMNLYYFLSTNIEDLYVLIAKFINCNDFNLLPNFIHFFQRLFLSTIKLNEGEKKMIFLLSNEKENKIKNTQCKYTQINIQKNIYFLNQIADNLLKLFIPRFISVVSYSFEQKFISNINNNNSNNNNNNNINVHMVVGTFSNLIHLCLYFSKDTDFNEMLTILEQLILRNEIEKEIFSLISLLTSIKIFIPFFSLHQINMCSVYYQKLIHMINVIYEMKSTNINKLNKKKSNRKQMKSIHVSEKLYCQNMKTLRNSNSVNNNNNNNNEKDTLLTNQETINSISLKDIDNVSGSKKKNTKGRNNNEVFIKNKKGVIKSAFKKKRNQTLLHADKLKNIKIKKGLKEDMEKLKFVRILLFDNIAVLFKYFGNILLKKNTRLVTSQSNDDNIIHENTNNDNLNNSDINISTSLYNNKNVYPKKDDNHLNKNELSILNGIYVDNKILEQNLPTLMRKESILQFFENITHYNINKYIKKFYFYLNSLTFYLKECKKLDVSYTKPLFYEILPIIMKSLFFINKKVTSKLKKNELFKHLVDIGRSNIKEFLFHVTPGLVLEEANCKKISTYILYLLIKNYKIEYEYQVQLFSICLILSNASEKNLLKVFIKYLLTCIYTFNEDIVLNNMKELMKLINNISQNKAYVFLIEKILFKLYQLLEHDDFINYLSKSSRKIFNNMIKKNKVTKKVINDEEDVDTFNVKDGKYKKSILNEKKNLNKVKNGYISSSSSCGESSIVSDNISTQFSSDQDDEENLNEDINRLNIKINGTLTKDKAKKMMSMKKMKKSTKYKNNNALTKFLEGLHKYRGEKETLFVKDILDELHLSKKQQQNKIRGKKNKNTKAIKYNPYIIDLLHDLQKSTLKKKKYNNLNVSYTNQNEIKELFGDKFFMKQKKNKSKSNMKQDDYYTDSDQEENVQMNTDGKIIIRLDDDNSFSNNKKKKNHDEISQKYNDICEKQNIHNKFKLSNNKSKKNKSKNDHFITAHKNIYKSKKGKGDIIKKNKLLPYSYVALKPVMTSQKYSAKTLKAFKSIKSNSKKKGKK